VARRNIAAAGLAVVLLAGGLRPAPAAAATPPPRAAADPRPGWARAIDRLVADGTVGRIYSRYGIEYRPPLGR